MFELRFTLRGRRYLIADDRVRPPLRARLLSPLELRRLLDEAAATPSGRLALRRLWAIRPGHARHRPARGPLTRECTALPPRLRAFELHQPAPKLSSGVIEPWTPPAHEPQSLPPLPPELDEPGLRHFVSLTLLDFDGDGEPIANLPLYVDHGDDSFLHARTNADGELRYDELPAGHHFSLYRGLPARD